MSVKIKLPDPDEYPDLSVDDILSAQIHSKWQAFDQELFQSKWWDYRFMSPFEATMAYIDAFSVEARKIYSRELDYERAKHINVMTGAKMRDALLVNDDKARKAFASFWRGRQVADAIGMPYGLYLYHALSSRMRAWQRSYLPTPAQIYRDRDVEKVAAYWEELSAAYIHYADHHAYLPQNYVGAPTQDAYYHHLIERSARTTDKILTLADMVDNERISLEFLAANLGSDAYAQVCKSRR